MKLGIALTMWVRRIKEFLRVPPDFGSGDFPEAWSKPRDHAGPDGDTPLKFALLEKKQGGLYAIFSGVMIWAAARLEQKTDVSALEHLAVALFLLQQDNSYYRPPARRATIIEINKEEKYTATVLYILDRFYEDRLYNRGRWPLYPNFASVAQVINLTRHHMGPVQRAVFDPWVEGIIARTAVLAPFPESKQLQPDIPEAEQEAQRIATMGPAIPPQALDLSADVGELDFTEAWRAFLTTVDWSSNRYLNPPEAVALASGRGRAYAEPR